MSPIFKVGYYPGDKPVKKRPGKPIQNIDPFTDTVIAAISFDKDLLGVPQQVSNLLEDDFRNTFNIRYGIKNDYVDGRINANIAAGFNTPEVAIEEEYDELPGLKGAKISLDPEKWRKQGAEGMLKSTLSGWLEAGLGFKDLSVQAELTGLWDPLLNPAHDADKVKAGMSLSSGVFVNAFQPGFNNRTLTKGDFKSVDDLSRSIRGYVQTSYSGIGRQDAIEKVKYFYLQSFKEVIKNSPQVADLDADILTASTNVRNLSSQLASLQSSLRSAPNAAAAQLVSDQIQQVEVRLKTGQSSLTNLTQKRSDIQNLMAAFNSVRDPKALQLANKGRFSIKALNSKERAVADNFWKSTVVGKNTSITQIANLIGDRRLVAWVRVVDYRDRVAKVNELIDAVAEGKLFQQYAWTVLKRRLPWLTPAYGLTKLFTNPEEFFWRAFVVGGIELPFTKKHIPFFKIPFIDKLLDKFGGLANKLVGWVTKALVTRFGGVINAFGGSVIKGAIGKLSGWLYGAVAGTGVGLPAVIVAAVLQWMGEKAFSVLKSVFSGNFEQAWDKVTNEMFRLMKACLVVFVSTTGCVVLVIYLAISFFLLPFSGMSVQNYGSGGGQEGGSVDCPFIDESELPKDANGNRLDNVKPLEQMINALTNTYANPKYSPPAAGIASEENLRNCYGYVIMRALQTANDPAMAMAIWIEESGASFYEVFDYPIDDFGCGRPVESSNFMEQIECFMALQSSYATRPYHAECRAIESPASELIVHEWGQIFACGDRACREGTAYDFTCLRVCGSDDTRPGCRNGTLWFDRVNEVYSAVSVGNKVVDLNCRLTGSTTRWDSTCQTGTPVAGGPGGGGPTLGQELTEFFRKTGYAEVISNYSDSISQCYEKTVDYLTGCPITSSTYLHCGIDLTGATVYGLELRSPYNGEAVVDQVGWDEEGYGNYVVLKVTGDGDGDGQADDEYYLLFGHMISVSVGVGDTVTRNSLLGTVGSTGNSTGAHVHYEIRSGGASSSYLVNPCYVFTFSVGGCPGVLGGGSCSSTRIR